MPTLHLLGTGAAISDPHRTTTMLAFTDDATDTPSTLLVDCGGDVLQRLLEAGASIDSLAGLIITHAHPDHVSGFPLFMEKIWLAGRRRPIPVCGIEPALDQARNTFEAFSAVTSGWDDLPEIDWRPVEHTEGATVWDESPWQVTASPVDHGDMPNVGLRVEHQTGGTVAYSCDTEPTDSVVALGRETDFLVHEANGEGSGHSSAEQAAEIAARAQAHRLVLVHLPPGNKSDAVLRAQRTFAATELGEEVGSYLF